MAIGKDRILLMQLWDVELIDCQLWMVPRSQEVGMRPTSRNTICNVLYLACYFVSVV